MIPIKIRTSFGWLGWVLVGAVIGGIGTHSITTAIAQQGSQQSRLRFISTGSLVPGHRGTLHFVSDVKSGGCWLAGLDVDGNLTALATAQADACQ